MALVAAARSWLGLCARGAHPPPLGPRRRLLGGLTLCDLGGSVISKAGGTFAAMNAIVEWISQPWPWYVAGPIIGLMVPLHLILLNRTFGISSSFRHVCAACIPNNLDFLKYDWKSESWNLVFAGGVLIGAFLAATFFSTDAPIALSEAAVARMGEMGIRDLSGQHPAELFSWSFIGNWRTLLLVLGGGFLVGFGTRYAGGCTSGHAIMGLSHFQLPSFVAVLGFFTGGLIMSWLVLPLILT